MYDVAIVGAGVIGCAIARELSKYKLDIVVLEKNTEVGEVTTKANSAIVHAGFDTKEGTLKAKMNVRGNLLMDKIAKELDVPFERNGSLVIAFDEDDEKELEVLLERGIKNNVPKLSIISGEEARKLEPNLSEKVTKALLAETAGIIDPFILCYGYIENAMDNGVELILENEVLDIEEKDGYFSLKTEKGNIESKIVINAAGLNSDEVSYMVSEDTFKIMPRKGEYRLLDKSEGSMVKRVIFQTPTKMGKGVLVTPTVHRNLLIGPTSMDTQDINDLRTTKEGLSKVDELSKKSVPDIKLNKSIRVFSGLRATPNTGDFMIYESNDHKGFINVAGIESPGLASSPAISEYVVELVKNSNRVEMEEKENFNPNRQGIKAFSHMTSEEKQKAISENPLYGKIICRCEMVSEAEILQAIRRNAGARTVDGVKRRVRAGMGRCQGGFCGPKVVEILSRELNIEPTEVLKDSRGSKMIFGRNKEEY